WPPPNGDVWRSMHVRALLAIVALLELFLLGPGTPTAPAASTPVPSLPSRAASRVGEALATGRGIVKTRAGRSAAALRSEAASYGATDVEEAPGLGAQVWKVAPGSERAVAEQLGHRGDVEYAEPDAVQHLDFVPNDSLYATYQWNMGKINAP